MFQLWYDLLYNQLFNTNALNSLNLTIFGQTITLGHYFSVLGALILTILVFIICLLCIWKVIRLFGRLFMRL